MAVYFFFGLMGACFLMIIGGAVYDAMPERPEKPEKPKKEKKAKKGKKKKGESEEESPDEGGVATATADDDAMFATGDEPGEEAAATTEGMAEGDETETPEADTSGGEDLPAFMGGGFNEEEDDVPDFLLGGTESSEESSDEDDLPDFFATDDEKKS